MWAVTKIALNSTTGKGVKTLDNLSLEDASQCYYNIAKILAKNFNKSSILVLPRLPDVEMNAFENNTDIEEIVFPPETKTVGAKAFYNCTNIKELYIPNVERLGINCFGGCPNLESVVLSSNLKKIDGSPFITNEKLTNIYFRGTMQQWMDVTGGYDLGIWTTCTVRCLDGEIIIEGE